MLHIITFAAMDINMFLLVGSLLLLISVIVGKAGVRYGIPSLLLFLLLGMLFGADGIGVRFNNIHISQMVGVVALNIILFSGGMSTKYHEIRPVMGKGILLSTLGVVLTTAFTGLFIYWLSNLITTPVSFNLSESLLLGAIMSSTDSASVFSILRSKRLELKENLRPLLELESGSNDPMAYMLTILLINIITVQHGESLISTGIWMFVSQLLIGIIGGFFFGYIAVKVMNRLRVDNQAMYPILLLAFVFLTYSASSFLEGNGYLAVYIAGLVVGNHKIQHKRYVVRFFDGFTWLFQIVLFLILGLLVSPSQLLPIAGLGVVIGLFVIFLARPLSVYISLAPFRKLSFKARTYISWVGLRGAVPILFATYPLINNILYANIIFNIVFCCTLVSLVVQGTTVSLVARLLKVGNLSTSKRSYFDTELKDEIKSATSEMTVTPELLVYGCRLMDLPLPDSALVVMVSRGKRCFIPKGATELLAGDTLLIITDDEKALKELYRNHNIEEFTIEKNQ